MGPTQTEEKPEISFFDVETTIPMRPGQKFAILEFGSIVVCPKKLVELRSFSSLVRPRDLNLISSRSVQCNGITRDDVAVAPNFADIADSVFEILHGRIWAGHNITKFDCVRIREAFAEIGRPPPEPNGMIDSLVLLNQKFGRRAGNMKMATLAAYFGLGNQTHRCLDDVRMNLEVLKYCATVLFLETSLPDVLLESSVSPRTVSRSRNPNVSHEEASPSTNSAKVSLHSQLNEVSGSLPTMAAQADPFDMSILGSEMDTDALHSNIVVEEKAGQTCSPPRAAQEYPSGLPGFVHPDEVSVSDIKAVLVPFYRGTQRIKLLHRDSSLQIHGSCLQIRFGINRKFLDNAGRPKLNFVVDVNPSLFNVLEACDAAAQKLSIDSGSSSEWRSVVMKTKGFVNSPTTRLHILADVNGDYAPYGTEIYQKDSSGSTQKMIFSRFDAAALEPLFTPGALLDAFFSLEPYDYQQSAGIRLVAKKLVVHS